MTLPSSAARFDVSLAWFPWVGAIVSLGLMADWLDDGSLQRPLVLAKSLAAGLDLEWGGSTLVCAPVADPDAVRDALFGAGIKAAVRGTSIRMSPHVYTTDDHVATTLEALQPLVR